MIADLVNMSKSAGLQNVKMLSHQCKSSQNHRPLPIHYFSPKKKMEWPGSVSGSAMAIVPLRVNYGNLPVIYSNGELVKDGHSHETGSGISASVTMRSF
jgi:hypothetical protein